MDKNLLEVIDMFNRLYLFEVGIDVWFLMQKEAKKRAGFTTGLGDINLYATPKSRPQDKAYASPDVHMFVAEIITRPNLVMEKLTNPRGFSDITKVGIYADFTASDARSMRINILSERLAAQKIPDTEYRRLSGLATATHEECQWVAYEAQALRNAAEGERP